MGHLSSRNYERMGRRLEQYAYGAFVSDTLLEILKELVTDEEARLCSLMPLRLASAEKIARIWRLSLDEAQTHLDSLAGKGMVFATEIPEGFRYVLAPPVLGFMEFSLMRTDGKLNAERLSELYYRYCQKEGDFIRQMGAALPSLSRVFTDEDMLEDVASEVLPYDRVSEGIASASYISTGLCYCRRKMKHMNKACDGPMDVCLTFDGIGKYLADQGIARKVSRTEAHSIVAECIDHGMVQIGDNTREGLGVICNCCGCCCDLLYGYKRLGLSHIISPSAFISSVDGDTCSDCGLCIESCPVDAITVSPGGTTVNGQTCIGCGICARSCPDGSCRMKAREKRPATPENFIEKILLASINTGRLGNYLYDDQTSLGHAVMRRAVNVLVRIPPLRALLHSDAVKSRIMRSLGSNGEGFTTEV